MAQATAQTRVNASVRRAYGQAISCALISDAFAGLDKVEARLWKSNNRLNRVPRR